MDTATTATFHLFLHLPDNLRARIWELTVKPRIVEVRVLYNLPGQTLKWPPTRHLRSPTPAPAQLQTCREARKRLTTSPDSTYRFDKAFSKPSSLLQSERYVWYNFDIDMLSIGQTDLHEFESVALDIGRLRLQRVIGDEYFSRKESLAINRLFRNLTEVHLICSEGIRVAYLMTEDTNFPCGPENVYFVDLEEAGGTIMNSIDLDAMVRREDEEYE
ncbi:hypothetical protein LZ30DRAFT_560820, partial [Colletotrichum cereale]